MKQVRKLMAETITLNGPVEIDEAEFGGCRLKQTQTPARQDARRPSLGMVERGGRVVAQVVPDVKTVNPGPIVGEVLEPETMIYSDSRDLPSSAGWARVTATATVNHSVSYVDGYAHTNTIDGFWSLVKRGIKGVYYQVGSAYLQSYLNEYAFRYNRRKVMRPMFSLLAERTVTQVCPSAREQRLLGS